MAKNQASESGTPKPAKRKSKPRIPPKHKWPKVLFPTEPTSIPPEKIIEAIRAVFAERKADGRK
ncbi:MAG TPA: hypothetical protein VEK57_08365 [Thermoanaerobaculia bacterium]|nr:hypothetical protein [Thermoanaerobaculia bacterium]